MPAVFLLLKKNFYLAELGLHCCTRAFSSFGEQGLLYSQCVSFSLQGLFLLQSMSSRGIWASAIGGSQAQLL